MAPFEFFIRRPVFATVISLIVVLIGIVSYSRLTVREDPNIDEPIVSVRTDYLGASPEIIETQVTQILEGSIAGIEGVHQLRFPRDDMSKRVLHRPDADHAGAHHLIVSQAVDGIEQPLAGGLNVGDQFFFGH